MTSVKMAAACYPGYELQQQPAQQPQPRKDYSRPLHVDCSVEYELPNAAKPPAGTRNEPLLMIHPCYYRRAESQRRSPFINNLPVPRQSRVSQGYHAVRYVDPTRGTHKRDPLLCGVAGDFSSGSDSGVSAGHWTDSDRSPLAQELRLHTGPDSGIATPSTEDKTALSGTPWLVPDTKQQSCSRTYSTSRYQGVSDWSSHSLCEPANQTSRHTWDITSELLGVTCGGEVNNNTHNHHSTATTTVAAVKEAPRLCQPAVGVAAVAASCKACHPQGGGFLHPQQRAVQQPWPGVTAPAVASGGSSGRHRTRAVEPGPEQAASSLHRRAAPWPPAPPAKRSRLSNPQILPPPSDCCKACQQWNYPQCRGSEDNSRILWNNESMLRLFQV